MHLFIRSALRYCTVSRSIVVTRASIVVRMSVVQDTTEIINAKFWGQIPIHHISRIFFIFFKIVNFYFFFLRFFSFSSTWDHMGGKISNDISSESTHHIHSKKIMHTFKNGLSTKVVQRIVKFPILDFFRFP